MKVKFAIDVFKELRDGDVNRRVRAALTFGMWFCAVAFCLSTAQTMLFDVEGRAIPVVGGLAITAAVSLASKFA